MAPGQDGRNHVTMANAVQAYGEWLERRGLEIRNARYKDLMDHVGHLQQQGKGIHRVNHALRSIGHYYDHKGWPNIAQGTRMRGVPRTQPQGLLGEGELQEIYDSYWPEPYSPNAQKRGNTHHHTDKLILGLIIFQALDMGEFMRMELRDVQLEKGTIYVRSGRYRLERYVPLRATQVLALDRYTRNTRPQLADPDSEKLFSPQADSYNRLHHQFKLLSLKMKAHAKEEANITILKLGQLRHSRIAIWVKELGLRKAQYLAGFRTVAAAERYQKATMEDLKQQVNIYHPLNQKQ